MAPIGYDALWTFAFALDKTNHMLQEMTRDDILNTTGCLGENSIDGMRWELVSLGNFTNDNRLMSCVIRWNLQRTDFLGVSVSSMYTSLLFFYAAFIGPSSIRRWLQVSSKQSDISV